MYLLSFWGGVAVGGAAATALTSYAIYLVIKWAYNDAEKGQVYRPSTKAIIEKYEEDAYRLN